MNPDWRGKLSVLLIDSSKEMLVYFEEKLAQLFREVGYTPAIVPVVSDSGSAANPVFDTTYFDVVICDVSLGKEFGDTLGLQALSALRTRHPGLYTIAYSRYEVTYNKCAEEYSFDLFISKQRIKSVPYRAYLVETLRKTLRINANAFVIQDPPAWPEMSRQNVFDLNRIVRKLTFSGFRGPAEESVGRVRLKQMTGGHSGALVLQMHAQTEAEFGCVQAILKVAKTEDARASQALREELKSYNAYVKWYLPYHWRPELLGEVTEGSISAICYAFVSSEDAPFQSLSDLASKGRQHEAIGVAIDSIFKPTFQRWYHKKNVEHESSLRDFYFGKCFGDRGSYSEQAQIFRREMRAFEIDSTHFEIDRQCSPYPDVELLGNPAGGYLSCLVHGDLNTRNIFASANGSSKDVTLIDFSETGRGHVFYDFIVFEVNLRLDVSGAARHAMVDRVRGERCLNAETGEEPTSLSGCSELELPYASYIRRLRQYARENFPDESLASYLYGVAVYAFSLLNAKNLGEADRGILASCTAAALLDLQQRTFWPSSNFGELQ